MTGDLTFYETRAGHWWDGDSKWFRSLHRVNEFRVALLLEWVGEVAGRTVVDLGCGGGLFSEALSERGARVLGVDCSRASLAEAWRHSRRSGRLYVQGDVAVAPVADAAADLVLVADVLEHVPDVERCVREAARIAAPGGAVYVNTLTRSALSGFLAVTVAEGLRLVPPGTHDARSFVRPEELTARFREAGLVRERLQGEAPRILPTLRHWALHLRPARRVTCMYSALFRRQATHPAAVAAGGVRGGHRDARVSP